MGITLAIKYHSYQIKCDDVISHVTTPQNAFPLIAKTDIYQFENNQCTPKEIGVRYIEMAINGFFILKLRGLYTTDTQKPKISGTKSRGISS